ESGIKADVLVCRTEHELSEDIRRKLAIFCNVKQEAVIQSIDASTIYDVPNMMLEEGLDTVVLKKLGLPVDTEPDLKQWNKFLKRHKNPKYEVSIGLIGKYVELQDSYKSILESFIHAGAENEVRVNIESIHSEFINESTIKKIAHLDGVLVAPGFGERGIEGKIEAVRYARENNIPFLGICLGMQMAVIEFARNVLDLKSANSTEMDPRTSHPVIDIMEEQKSITHMGGTMRLGSWKCELKDGTLAKKIYGSSMIKERHRHRYEYNNKYKSEIEAAGMISSGINPETGLVEIIELKDHPWFVGVQYHPEYKSTVASPHPLFIAFIEAAVKYSKQKNSVNLAHNQ
ncbi:MAG TPA: CTP synthase, partial [Gillisia sp.]|nr:CTP synthase [Gillisia sp.]